MPEDERTRLDRPQRWVTREHPEWKLLEVLEKCTTVTDIFELCLSIIDDAGYDVFVSKARKRADDFAAQRAKSGGEGGEDA